MAELDSIDLEPRHLKKIRSIFARHLPYKKVWAYGSRVKWTASNTSDLDCVVFGANDIEIANAREAFDESDIPFEVQLLNWDTIPDDFKENIKKGYFVLRNEEDWKETTLSEICYRIGDGLHGTPKYTIDTQYYFINGNNLKKGQVVITKNTKKIEYKEFQKYKKDLGLNTILLSINGTIGNLAKYNNELCILGKSIAYLNIRDDIIKNFIYYLMLDSRFQKDISHNANGSTIKNVSLAQLKNYSILLPPLLEQKAIASVLSSIDDKIDLLHRQNNTLESIAETIFRKWFIEEADDSWEEVSLSQLGTIICGKTPSKKKLEYFDGNVPFIKIPDMHGNTYITQTADSLTEKGKSSQPNKTISPFSICVSCIATIGLVSMTIVESQTNQQINTIIPYKEIYRYYLFLYIKSSFDLLHAMGSGGTATLNINTRNFSKMNISKPDDITLENFSNAVSPIFNKILKNQKQIKTLECLRDMLLPKLISGDIRVEYKEVS